MVESFFEKKVSKISSADKISKASMGSNFAKNFLLKLKNHFGRSGGGYRIFSRGGGAFH